MTEVELAERCEQATGPDRELDAEIYVGLDPELENIDALAINGQVDSWVPDFTASLDAAMTLVPEGWSATVVCIPGFPSEAGVLEWQQDDKGRYWRPANGADSGKCKAATPALALCAAALRARAIKDATHDQHI